MKQALSKLFTFLGKALSEDNGNPSSTRVNLSYAIWILIPCVAFTLIYTVIAYQNLLTYVLDAILVFISGLYGLKVVHKGKEQNTSENK